MKAIVVTDQAAGTSGMIPGHELAGVVTALIGAARHERSAAITNTPRSATLGKSAASGSKDAAGRPSAYESL